MVYGCPVSHSSYQQGTRSMYRGSRSRWLRAEVGKFQRTMTSKPIDGTKFSTRLQFSRISITKIILTFIQNYFETVTIGSLPPLVRTPGSTSTWWIQSESRRELPIASTWGTWRTKNASLEFSPNIYRQISPCNNPYGMQSEELLLVYQFILVEAITCHLNT